MVVVRLAKVALFVMAISITLVILDESCREERLTCTMGLKRCGKCISTLFLTSESWVFEYEIGQ